MKDLNYYMNLKYRVEYYAEEEGNGYVFQCPELPGCITCADSILNGITMLEDAKKEWFTACLEDNIPIPEPSSADAYSGQFKLRMPKSLHKQLAERSKQEGISMNQYCIYLLSHNV